MRSTAQWMESPACVEACLLRADSPSQCLVARRDEEDAPLSACLMSAPQRERGEPTQEEARRVTERLVWNRQLESRCAFQQGPKRMQGLEASASTSRWVIAPGVGFVARTPDRLYEGRVQLFRA